MSTSFDQNDVLDLTSRKSWKPTKKWLAAATGVVSSIALSVIVSGNFGATEQSSAKVAVVGLILAYLFPNDDTPGGVPLKK